MMVMILAAIKSQQIIIAKKIPLYFPLLTSLLNFFCKYCNLSIGVAVQVSVFFLGLRFLRFSTGFVKEKSLIHHGNQSLLGAQELNRNYTSVLLKKIFYKK